ncbi:hypothetical protein [Brunnivagina elsteri]|uniref:Oligosaccharide repeat unit polymerase n=1 Tax=Brunnivagina elsteri CCALA 953 TaxID=987040 RepID=A0A2A2TNI1_9CYAN|nr:hypothetical protein [Calothrix elsteri]PAX60010.1 hypothetical protein CK510_04110 [Calothrix elsteri CCALA 953]
MKSIVFAIILFSHVISILPFVSNARDGKIPNTSHFASISVMLYYDFGLALEVVGITDNSKFFTPFFNGDDSLMAASFIIVLLAPWLFHIGANFTNKKSGNKLVYNYLHLKNSTKPLFYIVVIFISLYFAFSGLSILLQNEPIWVVREKVGERWGALIVLLYLPIHFLGFYTRQEDSNTKVGLIFSFGLVIASILSTSAIGQRTNMLLPILIIVLFRKKISLAKIGIFLVIAIIAVSLLLPIFKWQHADSKSSMVDLITETITGDFYRGAVLATALEKSQFLGSKIMPYPMAGYVYSVLYYVPRQIAPFKGSSTSQTFTSDIVRTPVEDTLWAFGVGAIEELLLNIGFLWCIPGLIVYGMFMGLLDKLSFHIPSLLIPTRLAAIWLCGYESSTVLLMFGTMAGVGLIFHQLFVQKNITASLRKLPL